MTPASADSYGSLAETDLAMHGQLSSESRAAGVRLWPITPTLHAMQHIAYDQAYMGNPRRVHCYSDEDMVGKMKRIYIRCHGITAPHRSLQRYALLQNMRWRQLALAAPLGPAPLPDAPAASAVALPAALPDAPTASAALPVAPPLLDPPAVAPAVEAAAAAAASTARKRRWVAQVMARARTRTQALRMSPRERAKFLRTAEP